MITLTNSYYTVEKKIEVHGEAYYIPGKKRNNRQHNEQKTYNKMTPNKFIHTNL